MSDNVKILLVNCVPDLISQDSIESLKKKFPSRTFVIKGPEEIRDQKYCTVMVVLGAPKDRVEDIRAQLSIKSLFAAEAVSGNAPPNNDDPQCFGEDDLHRQPHLIDGYSIYSLTKFLNNVIKITKAHKAPKDSPVEQMSIGDLREKIPNFDKRFTVILLNDILKHLLIRLSDEKNMTDSEEERAKIARIESAVERVVNESQELLESNSSEAVDKYIARQKRIIATVRESEHYSTVSLSQDTIRDIFSEIAEKYVDKRSINEIQASRDIIALASSLIGEELLDEPCKNFLRRNYNTQVNNTPQQSIEGPIPRAVPATIDKLNTLVFDEGILNQLKAIIANFIDDKITLQVACGLIAPVLGLDSNIGETESQQDYNNMLLNILKVKPDDLNDYDQYSRLPENFSPVAKKEIIKLFLKTSKDSQKFPQDLTIVKLFLALASQEKFNQIVPLLKARVSNMIKDRNERAAIDHSNDQVSAMLEDQRRAQQAQAMITGYNAERESIKFKPKP